MNPASNASNSFGPAIRAAIPLDNEPNNGSPNLAGRNLERPPGIPINAVDRKSPSIPIKPLPENLGIATPFPLSNDLPVFPVLASNLASFSFTRSCCLDLTKKL